MTAPEKTLVEKEKQAMFPQDGNGGGRGSLRSPDAAIDHGEEGSTKPQRKNRGGRPRADEPRTTTVSVRLTAQEQREIAAKARDGVGPFLRRAALGHRADAVVRVPAINARAWRILAAVVADLEALLARADSAHLRTELGAACAEINRLRHELIGAPA